MFKFLRKQVLVQVRAQLQWAVYQEREAHRWIAACDPLNITVSADSEDAVKAAAEDAINLLFTDLFESGELEDFLSQKGWHTDRPLPQREVGRRAPEFRIPDLVMQRVNSTRELLAQA